MSSINDRLDVYNQIRDFISVVFIFRLENSNFQGCTGHICFGQTFIIIFECSRTPSYILMAHSAFLLNNKSQPLKYEYKDVVRKTEVAQHNSDNPVSQK